MRIIEGLGSTEAEVALAVGVALAASRSWMAAAWVLERRWPERWGPPRVREAVREADVSLNGY